METKIIYATKRHKRIVLSLLDEFRNYIGNNVLKKNTNYTTAKDFGSKIFDKVMNSNESVILLAKVDKKYVGVLSLYLIPQIRKGGYVAEIEEIFVKQEYQKQDIGTKMIEKAIDWSKNIGANSIRLESGKPLKNAHKFYQKVGFEEYAKAFQNKF